MDHHIPLRLSGDELKGGEKKKCVMFLSWDKLTLGKSRCGRKIKKGIITIKGKDGTHENNFRPVSQRIRTIAISL